MLLYHKLCLCSNREYVTCYTGHFTVRADYCSREHLRGLIKQTHSLSVDLDKWKFQNISSINDNKNC
jgi:hypothetical protein